MGAVFIIVTHSWIYTYIYPLYSRIMLTRKIEAHRERKSSTFDVELAPFMIVFAIAL